MAGLGILSTGHLACRAELASGALVRVLPSWEMGTVDVNALLPGGRAAKPSARAFIEFLVTALHDLSDLTATVPTIRKSNKSKSAKASTRR